MAQNPFKPQLFTSQPKYQAPEAQNNIVSTSITWTRLLKQRLCIMNKTRTYSPSILIKHQEEQIYSKQNKTTSRFKHSKQTSRTQILDIIVFMLCNMGTKEA